MPAAPAAPGAIREGMIAQWAIALPEVRVAADGTIEVDGSSDAEAECIVDRVAHGGLLAFLDAAAALDRKPARVKLQLTGPLTLGVALHAAGMKEGRAFRRAAAASRAWSVALEELVAERLPGSATIIFFDEPALIAWRRGDGVIDREAAIDVLSGSRGGGVRDRRARVRRRRRRPALEAGPQVLGVEVSDDLVRDTVPLARLDGDGWVAWGRCRPTAPSASRSNRTGGGSRRCGASSPSAGSIRYRCGHEG